MPIMNDPYILNIIARELAATDMFHNLNANHVVLSDILGVDSSHRDSYLDTARSTFILPVLQNDDTHLSYSLEAILQVLAKYWKDSLKRYTEAEDGIGMDGVRWSLIKTYFNETRKYIALVYYHFLLHPSDEFIDLEEYYPGINKTEIFNIIACSGNLTLKRIEKLEHEMRVKAGKEFEPVKYSAIPTSGIELVDRLPEMLRDKSLVSVKVRMTYWRQFQRICISKSTDNAISQEEKEIWVRTVINCLDAINKVADAEDSYGIRNLSAEFIGILESAFMQSSNPICVKQIARDIGAMYYFDQQVLVPGEGEFDSAHMEFFSEIELEQMMGNARAFYEKKLCLDCSVANCPYDIYWRMFQETGDDNKKYGSASPDTTLETAPMEESENSSQDATVVFRQLDGNLAPAQSYLEAIFPKYVDQNFIWKKDAEGVTNYHAYWIAFVISRVKDGISQQDIGNLFGIKNIHIYGTDAKLKGTYRDTIFNLFRQKSLSVPVLE